MLTASTLHAFLRLLHQNLNKLMGRSDERSGSRSGAQDVLCGHSSLALVFLLGRWSRNAVKAHETNMLPGPLDHTGLPAKLFHLSAAQQSGFNGTTCGGGEQATRSAGRGGGGGGRRGSRGRRKLSRGTHLRVHLQGSTRGSKVFFFSCRVKKIKV